jgi:hypothetical protein
MTAPSLPDPLVPAEVDLRGYDFMPLFGDVLMGSSFNATTNDTGWRLGVTLWWRSWNTQVPAASLPDDDAVLAMLCGLGRDVKTFRKVKAVALHGFVKCNDGRLYHKFLAPHAIDAWKGRQSHKFRTMKARIAALERRLKDAVTDEDKAHLSGLLQDLKQSLSQTLAKPVTDPDDKLHRRGREQGQEEDIKRKDSPGKPDADPIRAEIWKTGRTILEGQGDSRDGAGSFLGKLCKDFGQKLVLDAVRDCARATPAEAKAWLIARCQERRNSGGKQSQLEARNAAVAANWTPPEALDATH